MKEKAAALLAAVILFILAIAPPAQATIVTTFTQPDAGYVSATNLIAITTTLFNTDTSWTDGTVTVTSSSSLQRLDGAGTGWATWDKDPESERADGNTIPVLYAKGLQFIDLSFNVPLFLFGAELEPDAFDVQGMSMEYFSSATSLGIINRSVNGSGGSRLFAGTTDTPFDRVRISIADAEGFALAQLRYNQNQPDNFAPVPEPSTFLLVAATFVLVAFGYCCKKLWKL